MSHRNVELHGRLFAAYNAGDFDALIALCDPRIELHSVITVPGGTIYRGLDGVRDWYRDLADGWGDELRVEVETYFDLGDQTMTFHRLHAKGRRSGADVAMPVAAVMRWRNDLCTYFKTYTSREDALSDLGVSEEVLEPIAP